MSINITKGIERIQLDTNQSRLSIETKCGFEEGYLMKCMISNAIPTNDLNTICSTYHINPTVAEEYMQENTD